MPVEGKDDTGTPALGGSTHTRITYDPRAEGSSGAEAMRNADDLSFNAYFCLRTPQPPPTHFLLFLILKIFLFLKQFLYRARLAQIP